MLGVLPVLLNLYLQTQWSILTKKCPLSTMSKSKTNSFHCMRKISTIPTMRWFFAAFVGALSIFQVKREPCIDVTFESIRIELVGKISFVIVSQVLSSKLNILFIEKVTDQNNRFQLVNKYQLLINRDAFIIRAESLFTWFSFCFLRRTDTVDKMRSSHDLGLVDHILTCFDKIFTCTKWPVTLEVKALLAN